MIAHSDPRQIPSAESRETHRALDKAVLAVGALLLVAGLVSFFAFNWSLMSPREKFVVLVGTVALGAVLALWWRDPARKASLFLSFGATGVWLATIGQTYQTGADAWQLFAGWAALGLLWAWSAGSPLIWLMVLLLAQLAALRYMNLQFGLLEFLFRGLSGGRGWLPLLLAWASLALWEAGWRLRPALGLRGRLGTRVLGVLILGLSLWMGFEGSVVRSEGSKLLLGLASLLVLAGYALRLRRDLALLGFALMAASLLVVTALGRAIGWHNGLGTGTLLGLLFVALSSAIVAWIRKLMPLDPQAAGDPAHPAPPWFLTLIMGVAAWIGALLMLSFIGSLVLGLATMMGGANGVWLMLGVACIALGQVLFRGRESMARQQFALAFSLAGQGALVYALGHLLGVGKLQQAWLFAGAVLLMYLVLVVLIPQAGHRFFAVLGVWSALAFLLYTWWLPPHADGLREIRLYLPLLVVTALGLVTLALAREPEGLRGPPTRYGTLAALAVIMLVMGLIVPKVASEFMMVMRNGTAQVAEEFNAHRQWSLVSSLMLAAYAGWRAWPDMPARLRWPLAAALALATALLWRSPLLFMGLVFVAACWPAGRAGQVIGALLALLGFAAFYYDLVWPLWFKALMLAGLGSALLLGRWLWVRHNAPSSPQVRAWPVPGAALVGAALAVTLAAGLWGIYSKERILRQGQQVFLALAPVDPRSLMQGDYMALRFALAREIASREGSTGLEDMTWREAALRREGLAWIQLDERRIARLAPADSAGPGPGLLRLRFQRMAGGRRDPVQISTDAWFFQEGQAARFEAARYGEFVVDESGQALLVGLRDEALQPLKNAP